MPGPVGGYDELIKQAIMAQQADPVRNQNNGMPGAFPDQMPPPEEMQPPVTQVGAADTLPYGNGMAPRAGMPTDDQMRNSQADMQQALLLRKALQQMRAGR